MNARTTRLTLKILASAILVSAILALVLTTAAGARTAGKVIWHGSLSNGGKTAHVNVMVTKPSKLTYTVVVKPSQKVNIYTSIICSMGANNGNGSQDYQDGSYPTTYAFKAKAPLTRQILMPFPHPKYCTVEVFSNLSKSGKQTLDLIRS